MSLSKKDFKNFSKLLSGELGRAVEIVATEDAGMGYHSVGYRLKDSEGKTYFVKEITSRDHGFEYPERRLSALLVSDAMGRRAGTKPRPLGVVESRNGAFSLVHRPEEATRFFHLEDDLGSEALSFSEYHEKASAEKQKIDEKDKKILSDIVGLLAGVHGTRHPSCDAEFRKAVYNDGIRGVLTHPELTILALSKFPDDYSVLPLADQRKLIGLMYETVKQWMGREDRLRALHGDFWGSNIFLLPDGSLRLIDFSRIPWGDPGIDVGWFAGDLIWHYYKTRNPYYREMVDMWFRSYEEKTGDAEVRRTACLQLGFSAAVITSPVLFPDLDRKAGRTFVEHVMDTLSKGVFSWRN